MDIKTKSFKFKANFVITINKQNKQKNTNDDDGNQQPGGKEPTTAARQHP